MTDNKTQPTSLPVESFLETISANRRAEALELINIMKAISSLKPVMWGPSIIGFGSQHYKYDSGREGDMPKQAFSPRKAAITIYFNEGFDRYGDQMAKLGKFKASVSCLYINKLADINISALQAMLSESYTLTASSRKKPETVDEYIASVPTAARPQFDGLRRLVRELLPQANEVVSYGIIGYKVDDKRARVYISGWKDHVAIYPIPHDEKLEAELKPYIKGKGTLWFSLDEPLPTDLIKRTVNKLI